MYLAFTLKYGQNTNNSCPALYTALNELGYNCYHMTECCLDFRNDSLQHWNRAIDVKRRGYGKELKRRHFDLMLWRYDV